MINEILIGTSILGVTVLGIWCAIQTIKICFITFKEMVFNLSEECEK